VTLYKRTTPNGKVGYMLSYQLEGKKKSDSFSDEVTAIEAAETKARQLSTLGVKASQLTDDELRACVGALDALKPLGGVANGSHFALRRSAQNLRGRGCRRQLFQEGSQDRDADAHR
jgi:hypothetical protein